MEVVVVDGEGRPELGPRADHTLKIAYSVPVHLRPSSNVWRKLQWAFDPRSMYPHGCGVDDAAMQRVLESARQFDLIWFNKLRTPNMFPQLGMAALGGGYRRRAEHVRALDSPE